MKLDQKRWLILLAGIFANLCQGAAYASSVFAKPMLAHLGCMVPKMIAGAGGVKIPDPSGAMVPDMTKWALAFSINLACLPVGMLLSGKLIDRQKGRLVVIFGGIMFGLGMFLAGFSTTPLMFNITYGVMMGLGSGAAYGAVVSTAVRWFPDRRGLASGLAVGALGFGQFVIAPVAVWLMATAPAGSVAVLYAFKVLGIAFITIIALASVIIANPPADYKPAGYNPAAPTAAVASKSDVVWTQMLGRGRFWLLFVMYACGAFSGLMIISQASPIAQSMNKNILALGNAKEMAVAGAKIAALIGIANATGRVLWGFISDKIGRFAALALMFLITAIMMFTLPKMVVETNTLRIAAVMIGLCFGGYLGIFPPLCADAFGPKNMGVNYGLLFTGFSVAAVAGPYVGAAINKSTGSYNGAFTIAAVVALAGLVFTLIAMATNKKPAKARA